MDPVLDADVEAPGPPPVVVRSYEHVSRALYERPWAIQPHLLTFMAEMLAFRVGGGRLSDDEIDLRLAAARAQNGDRPGGAKVGNVAVIPMYGILRQRASLLADTSTAGTGVDTLRMALREALNDKSVTAVVFDIDSPGGAVDGIPEFAAELRSLRAGAKPIVGQVNTLCASAALWLAANMTELVVTASGEVGSIGIFAMHEDVSKAQELEGVKTTLITAGKFKTEANSFEPLTDEARAAIQDQVNDFYGMFVADVAKGRKVTTDVVESDYGQGRTLLARQALAAGVVDRIATLEQTVDRLQSDRPATSRRSALSNPSMSPALAASGQSKPDRAWNQRMRRILR